VLRRYFPVTAVVVLHLIVYGAVLITTNGLPYVMDGNESFSSLWHAANMFHFGLSQTFGLTDEAYGFESAAHPYLYTHQGNFPRLFAFALYALGAKSIEAQIALTIFSVGLTATLLAFYYFKHIVDSLFAVIACALLITDYVLVAQWHMVTYRIWHQLFVFGLLLCIHGDFKGRRSLRVGTLVLCACLCYFELLFATFLIAATVLYAALVHWGNWRMLRSIGVVMLAGALLGVGVLLCQNLLATGWSDFLADAFYTFVARNQYDTGWAPLSKITDFYQSRNIVFWVNLVDGSYFRTLEHFVASISVYEFQVHTPLLVALSVTLIIGLLFSFIRVAPGRSRSVFLSILFASTNLLGAYRVTLGVTLFLLHLAYSWIASGPLGSLRPEAGLASAMVFAMAIMAIVIRQRLPKAGQHANVAGRFEILTQTLVAVGIVACMLPSAAADVVALQAVLTPDAFVRLAFVLGLTALTARLIWEIVWLIRVEPSPISSLVWMFDKSLANVALIVATFVFHLTLFHSRFAFGTPTATNWFVGTSAAQVLGAAFAALLTWWLFYAFITHRSSDGLNQRNATADLGQLSLAALLYTTVSSWLYIHGALYNQKYVALWEAILQSALSPVSQAAFALFVTGVAAALAAGNRGELLGMEIEVRLRRLLAFVLTGVLAYSVIFVLSPGYVYTAYRFRYAPLTVFHTMAVIALPLYVLACIVRHSLGRLRMAPRAQESARLVKDHREPNASVGLAAYPLACIAGASLVIGVWYWLTMQSVYVSLIPPDSMSVFRTLSQRPFEGRSFIANVYSAPIAAATGRWAYLHESARLGVLVEKGEKLELPRDETYMWFADKKTNPAYARPAYFICLVTPSMPLARDVLLYRAGLADAPAGCEKHRLVELARSRSPNVYPALRLVSQDAKPNLAPDYKRWAILELGWD